MTLGQLLNLPKPQLPHQYDGENSKTVLVKVMLTDNISPGKSNGHHGSHRTEYLHL